MFFWCFINLWKLKQALYAFKINHWPPFYQNMIDSNKMHVFYYLLSLSFALTAWSTLELNLVALQIISFLAYWVLEIVKFTYVLLCWNTMCVPYLIVLVDLI
jgi:hypothetical protein